MSGADLHPVADAVAVAVAATAGVAGIYARPGMSRLTVLAKEGFATVLGSGSDGPLSPVGVSVTEGSTVVEFDVAVAAGHSAPVVARAAAAAAHGVVAAAGLPEPQVDVRVVSLG